MSESTRRSRTNAESIDNSVRQTPTEYVERNDVDVLLIVKPIRGTGTRDRNKLMAKVEAKTLEEARRNTETLREYTHDLAEDVRQTQPGESDE